MYVAKKYVEISHQVDGGFELLAHTQGIETTEGLYQAHARYILKAWDEGECVLVCIYPVQLVALPANILYGMDSHNLEVGCRILCSEFFTWHT